jgi:hypothetical protein
MAHHGPAQHPGLPPAHAPRRSQALAITALVAGVVAIVIALTSLRAVAPPIGLIAAVLAAIALIAKSQGGKGLAGGALGLGLAAIALTGALYMLAANQPRQHKTQQEITDCISQPGLTADEIWACTD